MSTDHHKRCLITGVAGFVGSSLADKLLADGHTVVGIDSFLDYYPRSTKERNLASARKNSRFEMVEGSLLTLDLSKLLTGVDWIFHQAGQAGVRASWGSYFETYVLNNILATQKLLEAAKGSSTLQKLVYASSSSVYGDAEKFPTSEDLVPRPVSPYGVTKLAAEHLVTLYASQFSVPTISLRYFTVYGPRQRPDMAFNRFARAALKGEELVIYGDGKQSRDFTFIDDIVAANISAAKCREHGAVLNLGGGTQATVLDVLDIIKSNVGAIKLRHEDRQVGDARHTSADTSRAQSLLGFAPKVGLAEGIGREVEWMRSVLQSERPH